jgi:simple sugar transport system permease protein
MSWFDLVFWEVVLAGGIRLATPVAFAALGETVVERSGGLNLGIEGMMLAGAFAGVYGSSQAGWAAGMLLGLAVGALLGAVMAVTVLIGGANQVVTGIAITLLGGGLASYLFVVWQPSGRETVTVDLAPQVTVPVLSDIPLVGPALFDQSLLTYLCVALAIAMTWVFASTGAGLALRAVGDDPVAANVRGVRAPVVRGAAYTFGGALAGVGGAAITVGYLGLYTDGVTAGRGFVALAVVIIGRWTPLGALAGAFLFAVFDSLALQRRGGSLPTEFWTALPYAVTLVVLVVALRNRRAPRALGRPLAVTAS